MRTYIIAEAGVNHNGDIKIAKKLIDMASDAGADAVKFQTFKAEESTSGQADKAAYQKHNDPTDESQLDMIRKLELPFEDFAVLQAYCKEKKIDFLSTPDGSESLHYLVEKLNVPVIKIGSTEVTNDPFLEEIARQGKPMILSTGMSTLGEVEKALGVICATGNTNVTLMHCTTDYPTAIEDVNLKAMLTLKNAFHIPVGYSDHTMGFEAAVAATVMGAVYIEKHITLDRNMPGPDHKASMPPEEFNEYVKHIRNAELLMGDGRKKPTVHEKEIMPNVRRSILARYALKKGTILSKDMFCYKRPGDGIYPEYADILVGRELKRDLEREEKISWEDV
jgi:N-acetylneuraminate synthase/N,N'-diacetyllegionaminate synthase